MESPQSSLPRLALLLFATLGACRRGPEGGAAQGADGGAAAPHGEPPRQPIPLRRRPDAGAPAPRARELPAANATVRIPAGAYHLGSVPGDPGRDPALEADHIAMNAPAVDIDALPWPNDPAQPPATGMTRAQAAQACATRGRRLCGELEWERACRGAGETAYPGGASWSPGCAANPGACASGYGVFAMGTRFAEWTLGDIDDRAVIRGASANATGTAHRCAARRTAVAATAGLEVAFRCCGGAPPGFTYPPEESRRPFRQEPMSAAQISEIIRAVPELERLRLRDGLALFGPGAINEVLNHGSTTADLHPEFTFTVSPVRWSPTFGEDVLVITARSRVGSWVAALWVLGGGRYRHAGSFLLRDDPVALTLAYNDARRVVTWSSCWNCGGEHGAVTYTDEGRVVITQR